MVTGFCLLVFIILYLLLVLIAVLDRERRADIVLKKKKVTQIFNESTKTFVKKTK